LIHFYKSAQGLAPGLPMEMANSVVLVQGASSLLLVPAIMGLVPVMESARTMGLLGLPWEVPLLPLLPLLPQQKKQQKLDVFKTLSERDVKADQNTIQYNTIQYNTEDGLSKKPTAGRQRPSSATEETTRVGCLWNQDVIFACGCDSGGWDDCSAYSRLPS